MRFLSALIVIVCLLIFGIAAVALLHDDEVVSTLPRIEAGGTPLESGTYETARFRPQTTFEIGGGWETASPETRDYFDVARSNAFQAISFARVRTVVSPEDPTGLTHAPAPKNLPRWVRSHPRLETGPAKKSSVDGHRAVQVGAQVKSAPAQLDTCSARCLPLFIPSDRRPVAYERGDRLRFLFVKVGSGTVTITVAAAGAQFKPFLPQAREVLSSVKLGKG